MTSNAATPRRSPRKQATAKKIRAEPHCNRCPGRPLLRLCPTHSAAARKQVRREQNQRPEAHSLAKQGTNHDEHSIHTVDTLQSKQDAPPSVSMQITNTIGDIVIDPQLLYECSATAHKEPNANHGVDEAPKEPNTAQHTPQERLSPQATSRGSSFTFVNYNIDNVTFGMSESSDSEGDSSSASDAPKNRKRLGRSKMRRQTSSKTGDKKRVRISGKNAPHGFVDGAFRGAIPWKVPRRRPVEAFEPSRELRNKAYTERMAALLRRCEELSNLTGCWLYISAHIPTYNHEFAHFASSPLIRDADRAMDDIHALHSNMHKSLSQATIRDVAKAEMEAAKARAEMRAAKESENVARQNVVDLQQSIEERDQVIAHLRAVLAGAGNGPAM